MTVEEILDYLRGGFESGRMAHAYILDVPSIQDGKNLTADAVSMVFCSAENKPCGFCDQCVSVKNHTHPDVWWVEPEKKSRQISVEQIRDSQRTVYQTSFSGGWKACVLVAADRLTGEAANAFLKTLEEPPERTVFFLVTESMQGLLSTIVSRCQKIVLSGLSSGIPEDIRQKAVDIISFAGEAGGKTGMLAMTDMMMGLFREMKEEAEDEERELRGDEVEGAKDKDMFDARVNARYREKRSALMKFLTLWYRDMLILSIDPESDLIHNMEEKDLLIKKTRGVQPSEFIKDINIISDMERQLDRNVAEQTVLLSGMSQLERKICIV